MRYDNAGNLFKDIYTGAGDRTYNAENRMTQAWANNQWQVYTYNADGQRVRRKVNGVETWQIYGLVGELLAERPGNSGLGLRRGAGRPLRQCSRELPAVIIEARTPRRSEKSLV